MSTTLGDNTVLAVKRKGETVTVGISGTYAVTTELQRAVTPARTAWETLKSWSTADATVAYTFTTERENEVYRLIAVAVTSGTAVYALTDGVENTRVLKDTEGNLQATFDQMGLRLNPDAGAFQKGKPYLVQSSTLTITAAEHAGRLGVLDLAAGIALILPNATGTGAEFNFFIKTTFTGASSIKSARSADLMIGHALMGNNSDNAVVDWQAIAASTYDTIDMYGSSNSTGGIEGQEIQLIDAATNCWKVAMRGDAAGTEATPFANTVS